MTDADSSGERSCSYDFDQDHLEAIWLEYQQQGDAFCPETGARLDLGLDEHPAEGGAEVAAVAVACSRCGRRADFRPDSSATIPWAE